MIIPVQSLIVFVNFGLYQFFKLFITKAGKWLPIYKKSRCFPDIKGFGVCQILLDKLYNFRVIHIVSIQWMEFSEQGLIAQVQPQIGVGRSVEVLVNWDTSKFTGDIEGQVVLGLNDPENSEIVLTLSGVVIPADIPSEPETSVKEEVLD